MSKLTIINGALSRIGEAPIASLAVNDNIAIIASNIYDSNKVNYLSSFPWTFALREVTLAPLATPSYSQEWEHAYTIPQNYLRVLGTTTYDEFTVYGNELYCGASAPTIIYIENIAEGFFSSYFSYAFELSLAADLIIPVKESPSEWQLFIANANRQWAIARNLDSQSRTNKGLSKNIRIFLSRGIEDRA